MGASGRGALGNGRVDSALEIKVFGYALLNPVGVRNSRCQVRCRDQAAFVRQGRIVEPRQAAPGCRQGGLQSCASGRGRVEDGDGPAMQQKAGGPAAADDARADDGRLHAGLRLVSPSRSRTSAGPITRAPRLSTILTACSTNSELVAKLPLPR